MRDIAGDKLTQLKEHLREKMKLQREEAIQKRYKMFSAKYGAAGYEAMRLEEDEKNTELEEAELTDQTDTDGEESEEEAEEMDEEEMAGDENEEEVRNIFNLNM